MDLPETEKQWPPPIKMKFTPVNINKNAATDNPLWMYCCHGWVNGIAWSPDGRYVASANTSKTVQVRESMTGTPTLTYSNHRSEVLTVAWSPDGTRLASADDDGIVRIWQAPGACQCASDKKGQRL